MDRTWMYGPQTCFSFLQKMEEFKEVALKHQRENISKIILCPCCDCNNTRGYRDIDEVVDHLDFSRTTPYSDKEIDKVRELWAEYFVRNFDGFQL